MYRFSHVQIKVNDIEQGIADFKKMGFRVERGGKKSKNAFIWFEKGPFIELLEMPKSAAVFGGMFGLVYGRAMRERWKKWCQDGEGMIDFAVEPDDDERFAFEKFPCVRREADNMRLSPSRIVSWSRTNIRNEKVRFSYMLVLPSSLPFIVSDYDIPQRPVRVLHRNGAVNIGEIVIECSKAEYRAFKKLTGYDNRIVVKTGKRFRILSISMTGLKWELPQEKLHNATIIRK